MTRKKTAAQAAGKTREQRYKPYPEPDRRRSGCKVAWHYYRSKRTANKCAEAAKYNAQVDLDLGYDFGYCMPGSVRKMEDGMFEVCIC